MKITLPKVALIGLLALILGAVATQNGYLFTKDDEILEERTPSSIVDHESLVTSQDNKTIQSEVSTPAVSNVSDEALEIEKYKALAEKNARRAFSNDPEVRAAFQQQIYEDFVAKFGREEADFQFALVRVGKDWAEVKRRIEEREAAIGRLGAYDDLRLRHGLQNGELQTEDLVDIVVRGHALPDDTAYKLAGTSNVPTILELVEQGVEVNLDYEFPGSGKNILGAYVDNIGPLSPNNDPEQVSASVERLLELGVPARPSGGGADALSLSLRYPSEPKIQVMKTLLNAGVQIEPSHIQMVESIQDDATREKIQSIFDGYR